VSGTRDFNGGFSELQPAFLAPVIPNQLRLALCFSRTSPATLAPQMYNARSRRYDPMPKEELTVLCENRPGTLAQVARVLGDAKVNILSFLTTSSRTQGKKCRR